jgi:HEPN domain-containing protein
MSFAETLFEIARTDLNAAKCLFDQEHYPQAVFYLQQSVEKATKSLAIDFDIIKEEEVIKVGHDPLKVYIKP